MKKFASILAVCGLLLAGGALGLVGCKGHHQESSGHVHTYTCPHHPEVVQGTPGTCPKCGMKLQHKD